MQIREKPSPYVTLAFRLGSLHGTEAAHLRQMPESPCESPVPRCGICTAAKAALQGGGNGPDGGNLCAICLTS
jgi:hypothetical protein